MRVDYDARTITFRQSGLETFSQCPERARFQWFSNLPDLTTDAAATGTATHAGIEASLRSRQTTGDSLSISDMIGIAVVEFETIEDVEGIKYVKGTKDDAMTFIAQMMPAWRAYVEPYVCVDENLLLEWHFNVPLIEWESQAGWSRNEGEWHIRLTGTADCVDRYQVWDWKTAASGYKQWEKQRWAVQPTVYAYAAEYKGLLQWPISFKYGALRKLKTKEYAEIVRVQRHPEHVNWLLRQILAVLKLWDEVGEEGPWPLIDTHALCSEKWCPYWAPCKGAQVPIGKFLWKSE